MIALPAEVALWFIPFVVPICFYVAFTDLAKMKITNKAVVVLTAVFVVLGPFLLPIDIYLWQLVQIPIVLVVGIALNAGGAMGAGDAKFLAAAAPYIMLPDLRLVMMLFAACLLAAYTTHRLARATGLKNLAPHWESWEQGKRFPMGLALGPMLALYLCLAALNGA